MKPKETRPDSNDRLLEELYGKKKKRVPEPEPRPSGESRESGGPSILQEVFAETTGRPRRARVPIWAIVAAIFLVFIVLSLVYRGSPGGDRAGSQTAGQGTKPSAGLQQAPPQAPPPVQPPVQNAAPPATAPLTTAPATSKPAESAQAAPLPAVRPPNAPPSTAPAAKAAPPKQAVAESKPANKVPEQASDAAPAGDKPQLVRASEEQIRAAELKAFETLREKSDAARALVEGNIPELQYTEWQVLRKDGDDYWIDVTAEIKGAGQSAHFIWSVNSQKGTIRAMSQAARDIESRKRM